MEEDDACLPALPHAGWSLPACLPCSRCKKKKSEAGKVCVCAKRRAGRCQAWKSQPQVKEERRGGAPAPPAWAKRPKGMAMGKEELR